MTLLRLLTAAAILFALRAQGDPVFYPGKENAWFSIEVPAAWKPKIDDETLEANSPDDEANLVFSRVEEKEDFHLSPDEVSELLKESLKDSTLKDPPVKREIHGVEFLVFEGSGHDSDDQTPVTFQVWLFAPQPQQVGYFYLQSSAKASSTTARTLLKIVESLRLAK